MSDYEYYNERASDHDDVYTGACPKSPWIEEYVNDSREIEFFVKQFGKGRMLDFACGTGYWVSFYEKNCESILLLERSPNMLRECRSRIKSLGIETKCTLLQSDFFEVELSVTTLFDCSIGGFIFSHLDDVQLGRFLGVLRGISKAGSEIFIVDSTWSERRKTKLRVGVQGRELKDGRRFQIFKRYFTEAEIARWKIEFGLALDVQYWGPSFFCARGILL